MVAKTTKVTKEVSHSDIDEQFAERAKLSYARLGTHNLDVSNDRLRKRILLQSIQGHAQAGHVGFYTKRKLKHDTVNITMHKYPNATIWDVIEALPNIDVDEELQFTEDYIESIQEYLLEATDFLHRKRHLRGTHGWRTNRGYPIPPGTEQFYEQVLGDTSGRLAPQQVQHMLAGAIHGARMDSWEWRTRAENRYELQPMNKGTTLPLSQSALRAAGVTKADLSSGNYRTILGIPQEFSELQVLTALAEMGLTPGHDARTTRDIEQGYVNFSRGMGTSDDFNAIGLGIIESPHAMPGLDASDLIDTLEKFTLTSVYGGYDERIGTEVEEHYIARMQEASPISDEKSLLLIRLTAIDGNENLVSSSQRRLHQWQPKVADGSSGEEYSTAFIEHGHWVQAFREGIFRREGVRVGFEQVKPAEFYGGVTGALTRAHLEGHIRDPQNLVSASQVNPKSLDEAVMFINA